VKHVVVAVIPDMHHVVGHGGAEAGAQARQALLQAVGTPERGLLIDGIWATFSDADVALDGAFALASTGAAVALAAGDMVAEAGSPPTGAAPLLAANAARAARSGELLVPSRWLDGRELPLGVGRFPAPEGLIDHAPQMAMLKDYR